MVGAQCVYCIDIATHTARLAGKLKIQSLGGAPTPQDLLCVPHLYRCRYLINLTSGLRVRGKAWKLVVMINL